MYVTVRKRQPQPKPTVLELRIAHAELTTNDAAVLEYFKALEHKGEEVITYLDCVRLSCLL